MVVLDVLIDVLQENFLGVAFLFRIRYLDVRTASYA